MLQRVHRRAGSEHPSGEELYQAAIERILKNIKVSRCFWRLFGRALIAVVRGDGKPEERDGNSYRRKEFRRSSRDLVEALHHHRAVDAFGVGHGVLQLRRVGNFLGDRQVAAQRDDNILVLRRPGGGDGHRRGERQTQGREADFTLHGTFSSRANP